MDVEQIYEKFCNLGFDQKTNYARGICDINEHLPTLRKYSSMCEHVTEMGTRFGVSVHALIIGKPKKVVAIDLNKHFYSPYENEIKNFAKECNVDYQFIENDVLKIEIETTDLLFIDTLHTYNQLSSELRKHEKNVKKWIVLHDTVTYGYTDEEFYKNGKINDTIQKQPIEKKGLFNALIDFLNENKNWVIKEQFTNNNGLTILEKIIN